MKEISNQRRVDIEARLRSGQSVRAAAMGTGVSPSTVGRIRRALGLPVSKAMGGRPPVLTAEQKRRVLGWFEEGLYKHVTDALPMARRRFGENVTNRVLRLALREQGMRALARQKKPLLKPRHRAARRAFAFRHSEDDANFWQTIVWSDESKICLFGSDGRHYSWRRPGETIMERHITGSVKHDGGSVMVWGCFSADGVGPLVRIEGIMDGSAYRRILQRSLLPKLEQVRRQHDDGIFQHDNDPKHTARATAQALEDWGVEVLQWPAQSPDLNPIEHLWAHLKRRLRGREVQPTNREELWAALQEEWGNITPEFCRNLVESMPRRVAAVRASRGGVTKY